MFNSPDPFIGFILPGCQAAEEGSGINRTRGW